jgi:DNA-binding beta-propeller fold protein YncE
MSWLRTDAWGYRSAWRCSRAVEVVGRTAVCLPLAMVCVLVFCGGSAQAAIGHKFLSSLSEAPPGTALKEPGAVAVDRATGEVFVADPGSGVVDVFSSTGTYVTRFGEGLEPVAVAVDEASGDVYVAEPFENAVLVFKPNGSGGYTPLPAWSGEGTPAKGFGEVVGVAVDNSNSVSDPAAGDVYVVERESVETEGGAVDVFKPNAAGPEEEKEGKFLRSLAGVKLEEPNGVAVNSTTGRVYVADSFKGAVDEFSSAGAFEGKMTGSGSPQGTFRGAGEEEGNVTALAVDEGTGDLLVAEAERHVVSEFNAANEWVGWLTRTSSGPLGEPRGVAVASSGGVYVGDSLAHVVDVFGAGVVVPDVKTTPASKLTRTTAILNGAINGDGKTAKYHFEWGETEVLGSSTPVQSSGVGEEKVSATLGGLHAGTTYLFRLSGENENGTNFGGIHKFTTPPAVEALSTGPVQNLTPSGATLTGSLTPGGADAHYYFEWGLTTAYGSTSPTPPGTDAGSGAGAVAAKTELGGLAANTTYHYRLVGVNSFGTTFGEDAKFTTSGPPRITSEATSGIGHETATIKARVNPDQLATVYHFEYGETTSYGIEMPLGGASIGSGSEPIVVSAALTGLKLGVTYHFRVVASNSAGTTHQPDQTFTTIPPALIDSESAAGVSSTAATLQTQINPLGHDTTFFFQYGTSSCKANPAGCTNQPAPPGTDIGSGEADQPGGAKIQELKPGTTYFYRVLATNSLGTAEGTEHTFTTQQSAAPFALPDARAWEMVTPPDKHGAPIEPLTREGGWILASEDGSRFAYLAGGAINEEVPGNRSPEVQQIYATRGPERWSSQDIVTPQTRAQGVTVGTPPEYQFFTPDLSLALVEPAGVGAEPPLAPGVTQKTMYLRDNTTGTYLPLVTEANVPETTFQGQIRFLAATPDLSHVIIGSKVALTGASAPGLYEWAAGKLQPVSVLPAGTPASNADLGYLHVTAHAVSNDGSRVIWTTFEEPTRTGHLYMRDTVTGTTLQLDAAQGASEPLNGSAQFQTASSDGSRVFFTDKQRLTADSTSEPTLGKADLYECEVVEENGKLVCHLRDLTVDHNEGEHAAVQGFLLGSSEDGSSVYLVAQGVLAGNENGNGERAEVGGFNLYELHSNGTEWTTTFIAVLSTEDKAEWQAEILADTAFLTARVSPNGRYLAFMSAASPTGYDNRDQNSGKHDQEVYIYDSSAGRLTCASCNPTGARPLGVLDTQEVGEGLGLLVDQRRVWLGHYLAGNIPGWTAQEPASALYQTRYLSDSGRLFFNSPDDLVPRATNNKENVYEYEPTGLGSCESSSGGCVALISSGNSDRESAFLEATPSGNDVFFLTAALLLPQDTDTAFDIYDARVCTQASPCLTPPSPAPPGCSTADGCRPASPSQQAPIGPSGSATFSGAGNIVPPPPAKQGNKGVKTTSKPLTRAQKLSKALKACKKQHSKKKRKACEAHAKKLYGPKPHAKKTAKARKSSSRRSGRGRR